MKHTLFKYRVQCPLLLHLSCTYVWHAAAITPPQVCTTLGMLTPEQAKQLREAGLTAYNHNLDTSPEYYSKITTTRKYEVRLTICLGPAF